MVDYYFQERPVGIWDQIAGYAYGVAFIGAGVGVGYATIKYVPKKFKPVGYIAAIGLGSYGAYSIYKKTKEEEGEPAQPDEIYPITITSPTPGEEWSKLKWHRIKVQVNNPYGVAKKVFIGMSMIEDATGNVYDFPVEELSISANSIKETKWWLLGTPNGSLGLYWVVSSVWDILPTGDCEAEGTCHRLGTAESNVIFTIFG